MSRKTPKGRAADARGRAARREARRAESRVTFCVSHGDRLCIAVPRCGPARAPPAPRAATESDGFGRSQSENVEAKFPSDSVSGDGFGRLSRTLFAIKNKPTPETRPDDVSVSAADPSLPAVPHDAVLPE